MVDALVSSVLEQLLSVIQLQIQEEVTLVVGLREEIEDMSRTFQKIQAVLKDAEKKQVKEESVKLWLKDLNDVAYDLDDVLDEWRTKILIKAQAYQIGDARVNMKKKVCPTNLLSACFCFNEIGLCQRHYIGHRIKKIKERLDKIAIDKDRYNFIQSTNNEKREEELQRPQTSSVVDVSEIFGRDPDKDLIISKLLSESSQQEMKHAIPIISIVGMGGLGKTTLAQFAYNDNRVESHFQKRIWVCLSEPFDKVKIAKLIIKAISDKNAADGDGTTWDDAMHRQLSDSVDGKHFLLVLDDVWSENPSDWDPLRISLNQGTKESRILVTTRNEKVALIMGATYNHTLGTLSDEDCWSLLKHMAFLGKKEEECVKLEDIGRKITAKCKGLPLSTKIIGSLLRYKKTVQDWHDVLGSHIWDLPAVEKGVLPALLLSYNDLSSNLKRCFVYCAIFPKDHCLEKNTLINMWMAQGFLNSGRTRETKNLEIVGREYFDDLVMRSFFQNLRKDHFDGMYRCYMHDLVHDLAQSLTESECFIAEIRSNAQELHFSNSRHLTLTCNSESDYSIPSSIFKAKNLRTLQLLRPSGLYSQISAHRFESFQHLICIRVLNLSNTNLQELPSDVEILLHLRYLDLSETSLKELPEAVSNLFNLQTLKLENCNSLCKLPKGLERLINLRHLMLDDTSAVTYLPQGIGRLSSLCILSKFIVGGDIEFGGGCKIGELKNLNLQEKIEIRGLGRVANGNEANEVELKNKQHLRYLHLYFDGDDEGDSVEERTESVLEALQPHPYLEVLKNSRVPWY